MIAARSVSEAPAPRGKLGAAVTAIAECLPEAPAAATLGPGAPRLGLPPGSLPLEPARSAVRSYRARSNGARLVAAIDAHGDALEVAIARKATETHADFVRCVRRLETLHERLSMRLAQAEWLRGFPCQADVEPLPLTVAIGRHQVEVPVLIEALSKLQLDERLVANGHRSAPRRRGRSASMVALAEADLTTGDVAAALGISRSRAWAILNGHQPVPADLGSALERLAGAEVAELVLASIPKHPRARASQSPAVKALHEAGATAEDLAGLVKAQPATVRGWLSGRLRAPASLGPALEQLIGPEEAALVLLMIPRAEQRLEAA